MKIPGPENRWILYAVLAGLCWGIWGVLTKFISSEITPYSNHLLFTLGMLLTLPFILKKSKDQEVTGRGLTWGILAGVLAAIGNIAAYKAFASGGQAAIVIPVTNLYPLVTIVIALIVFKEKLNRINVIGIFITVPALVLLSGETLLIEDPRAFIEKIGMDLWLLYSFIAILFWGVFSITQKITTNHISAEWAYISFIIASFGLCIIFSLSGWAEIHFDGNTILIGTMAGLLNGLGVLASFAAYHSEGKASTVTTIAGTMQPVFTILLAIIFLKESLDGMEMLGIVLAIIGSSALSFEKSKPNTNEIAVNGVNQIR